ncbi:MAG: hypothetical protein V9G11_00980, partial [Bifidobacterium adolescentis]
NQTQILLGGANDSTYSTTVNLSALSDKYPNGAHVTVYATDATAPADLNNVATSVPAASDGPYVVADQDLTITDGQGQPAAHQPQGRQRLLCHRHAGDLPRQGLQGHRRSRIRPS